MFRLMTLEMPAKVLVDFGVIPFIPAVEKVDIVSILKMGHDSLEMICRIKNPPEGIQIPKGKIQENTVVNILSSGDGEATYYIKFKVTPHLVEVFLSFDMYIHYPMIFTKEKFVLTFMGKPDELARFVKLMKASSAELTVVSVQNYIPEELSMNVLNVLSPAQRNMLRLATEKGYFEFPRRTDTRKLAKISGLRPSTVSEHIRRGQGKVFGYLFDS